MIFTPTLLPGAFVIDMERREDARGFFARTWCRDEMAAHGLSTEMSQCSVSFNHKKGTVRGMHFQAAPYEEAKCVRCTRGALYDVLVDLRPASPTFARWTAVELTEDNRRAVYIPAGVAHGFQTLTDGAEVFYQISEAYHPESARGVRWNDPFFGIAWPLADVVISARDSAYPLWGTQANRQQETVP